MPSDHRSLHPLRCTASIRAIEQAALAAAAPGALMARAAAAVAGLAEHLLRQLPAGTPVHAVCGPGNNGGDALLAAMLLHERGFDARAFELADCAAGQALPADAARVRAQAAALGLAPVMVHAPEALRAVVGGSAASRPLLIDGLFGIGLTRPLDGLAARFCELVAELGPPVVAVDVPSGIDANTGAIVGGPAGRAVRATATVTMIADKPGLRTGAAADHVGRIELATLGLAADAPAPAQTASHAARSPRPDGQLVTHDLAVQLLPPRPRDSSKGRFGSVLVAGGAEGMAGAALLAARAAQCAGAGKVAIASPDSPVFDPAQPQLMSHPAGQPVDPRATVVAGCGLGTHARASTLLDTLLASGQALVLDADALNLLARHRNPLPARARLPVLTPHPLEAARLAGTELSAVQADRIGAARTLAATRHAIVVLKGAGTVIADPDGRWAIIDSGGPALATAGSGDVLAGLIGGLLAQGLPSWDAALLGSWAHGAAGDRWAAGRTQPAGLSAAELPTLARELLSTLARRATG